MKKPNITEGEWVLLEESAIENGDLYLVNSEDGLAVHDSFHRANAQAISAVPEMLDALMASKRFVDVVADENVEIDRDLKSQINNALKKAGVQL